MNFETHSTIRLLIRKILERPHNHDWSLQGFGMLRLYLSDSLRLHVWDETFAVPGVSIMHTHPWDFTSTVIAGYITNRIYRQVDGTVPNVEWCMRQLIKCGVGGGPCESNTPEPCHVKLHKAKTYVEGQRYAERSEQIHTSHPVRGTVTLVKRSFKQDTEHAYVYWPYGGKWISAEPKPARKEQVESIASYSLREWFSK